MTPYIEDSPLYKYCEVFELKPQISVSKYITNDILLHCKKTEKISDEPVSIVENTLILSWFTYLCIWQPIPILSSCYDNIQKLFIMLNVNHVW